MKWLLIVSVLAAFGCATDEAKQYDNNPNYPDIQGGCEDKQDCQSKKQEPPETFSPATLSIEEETWKTVLSIYPDAEAVTCEDEYGKPDTVSRPCRRGEIMGIGVVNYHTFLAIHEGELQIRLHKIAAIPPYWAIGTGERLLGMSEEDRRIHNE